MPAPKLRSRSVQLIPTALAVAMVVALTGCGETERTATSPEQTPLSLPTAAVTAELTPPSTPATPAPSVPTAVPADTPTPAPTDAPTTTAVETTISAAMVTPPQPPPTLSAVVIDPETTPRDSVAAIREQLRDVDPLTNPQLAAEKNAVMQAHLSHVSQVAEATFEKDPREEVTDLAGKIQYQLDEAQKAADADASIKNLKRVEELLTALDKLLEPTK